MTLEEFLNRVIDDGIAAVKKDYRQPHQKEKRDGSIAGFEACRGKTLLELNELLQASHTSTADAHDRRAKDYWWFRCYELEVEWVCNCVSALLVNQGLPPIIVPTARGMMKAAGIVGVAA